MIAAGNGNRYDVFVSYRWRDPIKNWVRHRLVPAIESHGISVCLDTTCFDLGVPLVKEMERAVLSSRVTISVLSHAYEQSGFTDLERIMAQHLSAELQRIHWIAVLREQVDMSLLDRFRNALDMTDDEGFEADVDRLVRAIRRAAAGEASAAQ